ncbi:MAG TPA: efflux RND transporter periplasmic adaptor subunit [Psychromonas sp.]
MKYVLYKIVLLTLAIASLWGCSKEEEAVKAQVIRPVKTMVIEDEQLGSARSFPGRVEAVQRAQISFRVPGKLIKIHVKEGQSVKKGDLLAELDPTDYQITLNKIEANYNKAKADYTRGKELVADGYISRTQFDKLEADFSTAKGNLEQAQQDLEYTTLVASFDGIIAKRYVDNFEEVQAKQEIFNLSDVSQVEIKIDVPERIMSRSRDQKDNVRAFASFGDAAKQRFPLALKEVATKADSQTQTFEVTFVMEQPEQLTLLPGMTANVEIELPSNTPLSKYILLPTTAVKGSSDMKPTVFVVDPESKKLIAKVVRVGSMVGRSIKVTEGLATGDRVVIAGISFMREGEEVSLMEQVEQADPATAP